MHHPALDVHVDPAHVRGYVHCFGLLRWLDCYADVMLRSCGVDER
ncbi:MULTISPECIES: hypothetical protein [Acinetobacter]|nr:MULTISPECIES: hypothetical protein [Acinetobacter]